MASDLVTLPAPRSIWLRGLLMIVMSLAFQLAATLLVLVAVVQFVLAVVSNAANARLCVLGKSLGQYLLHIAQFESFATEQAPFPFSDWPAGA